MLIESTLNIHYTIMDKINEASEETGESRNFIINMLLKRAMINASAPLSIHDMYCSASVI